MVSTASRSRDDQRRLGPSAGRAQYAPVTTFSQLLALDEALDLGADEGVRALAGPLDVAGGVRGDEEVRGRPERVALGQRLGLDDVEGGAEAAAR